MMDPYRQPRPERMPVTLQARLFSSFRASQSHQIGVFFRILLTCLEMGSFSTQREGANTRMKLTTLRDRGDSLELTPGWD